MSLPANILALLNDPDRREKTAREQAANRERLGSRLASSPAQSNYLFGQAREQAALDQLEQIPALTDEHRAALYNQLAEGMALQGRFEEAASICQSPPHKAEYLQKAEALRQQGVKACECPAQVIVASSTDAKGEKQETQRRIEEVFDGEKMVAFVRCDLCKGISAA